MLLLTTDEKIRRYLSAAIQVESFVIKSELAWLTPFKSNIKNNKPFCENITKHLVVQLLSFIDENHHWFIHEIISEFCVPVESLTMQGMFNPAAEKQNIAATSDMKINK